MFSLAASDFASAFLTFSAEVWAFFTSSCDGAVYPLLEIHVLLHNEHSFVLSFIQNVIVTFFFRSCIPFLLKFFSVTVTNIVTSSIQS